MIWIALFVFTVLNILLFTWKNGISPMPSNAKATHAISSLLPTNAKRIVDLGSGFGFFLYQLAKQHPEKQFVGMENSWLPYFISKIFSKKNLTFVRQDFYHTNLQEFDIVITYLCPKAMQHIEKMHIQRPLISNTFALPNQTPTQKIRLNDWQRSWIYVYDSA